MITREEALRGVVTLNGERSDEQTTPNGGTPKVHGDDTGGGDESTRRSKPRDLPGKGHVSAPQESLLEFAERRSGEVSEALEGIARKEASHELTLKRLRERRHELLEELNLLENFYVKDQCTSAGHQPTTAPEAVLPDQGGDGGGRGGRVGGKHNRKSRGHEKGPDA